MPDYNSVTLMGRVTREVDLKYTPKGTALANMDIAINRKWKDSDGKQQEEVTFVGITVWGRQAETCKEYLGKGSSVFVEGRLHTDQWEDSEGKNKSALKVIAERVQFLGQPKESQKPKAKEERPIPHKTVDEDGSQIPF